MSYIIIECAALDNPENIFNHRKFPLVRGQLITSLRTLSDGTGLSIQQIRTGVKNLKKMEILTDLSTKELTNRARLITIIDTDTWLHKKIEPNKEPNKEPNNHLTDHQQTPNNNKEVLKNLKEGKEINNKDLKSSCGESKNDPPPKKVKKVFDKDSWAYKLSKFQYDCIKYNDPGFIISEKKIQHNCDEMDKLIRLNKREPEEIGHVIEWIRDDDFNKGIVLCSDKLRKRYPELRQRYIDFFRLKRKEKGRENLKIGEHKQNFSEKTSAKICEHKNTYIRIWSDTLSWIICKDCGKQLETKKGEN